MTLVLNAGGAGRLEEDNATLSTAIHRGMGKRRHRGTLNQGTL